MNYAIQYHETSGDWLIFDIGEGFELVGMYSTEKDAKRNKNQLEKAFAKRAQWTIDPMYQAAKPIDVVPTKSSSDIGTQECY